MRIAGTTSQIIVVVVVDVVVAVVLFRSSLSVCRYLTQVFIAVSFLSFYAPGGTESGRSLTSPIAITADRLAFNFSLLSVSGSVV